MSIYFNIIYNLFRKVALLENITMGKFFLTNLLTILNMERNMIIEGIQAVKEIAKQKDNYTKGRSLKYTKAQLHNA